MNKIFKTMRNKNGVETVVSELAKGNKKGLNMSVLVSALMLSLFSSQSSAETDSKIGIENNTMVAGGFGVSTNDVAWKGGNLVNARKYQGDKFGLMLGVGSKDNIIKGKEVTVQGNKNILEGINNLMVSNTSTSIGHENLVTGGGNQIYGSNNIITKENLERTKSNLELYKNNIEKYIENSELLKNKKNKLEKFERLFEDIKYTWQQDEDVEYRKHNVPELEDESWYEKSLTEVEKEYRVKKDALEAELAEIVKNGEEFENIVNSFKTEGSTNNIAIGNGNTIEGMTNTVAGQRNEVKSSTVVALGSDITVENSNFSTAIGGNNVVKNATMANVIGNGNTVKSGYTTVVGNGIEIGEGYENAIVLGNESKVKRAEGVRDITIKDNVYSFAGTNPIATMSIGDLGAERQIVNVAAGRISDTSTDAINGSQLYALVEEVKKKPSVADISSEVVNLIKTKLIAGNNINIEENQETNTFTINAVIPKQEEGKKDLVDTNTQNTLSTEGNSGISLVETRNENGTTNYKVAAKVGKGLAIDEEGNIISTAKETVDTNTQNTLSTEGNSGISLVETKNENGTTNYKVAAKVGKGLAVDEDGNIISTVKETVDTNTQNTVSTEGNSGINLVETKNENGTTNYKVSAKVGKGLAIDEDGNIISTVKETIDTNTQNTLSTEGNSGINLVETKNENGTTNYKVSAKVGQGLAIDKDGNIISTVKETVDTNTQNTVSTEGNSGISLIETKNENGTTNYKVAAKLGEGLTFDENGNIASTVKGVVDTNTQNTLSTEKESGINLVETKNENGTTNYKVTAKLGEGLFFDQDGNIASTVKATNINGGKGVTVNKNENNYVIDVVGVISKTDDGKTYERKSLQEPLTIKGDGKNIKTSTNDKGEVVVGLNKDIQVDSVTINNGGPTINQDGINMNENRIKNLADGINATDAVNVRQLRAQGNQFNQRLNDLDNKVNKNRKRSDAGIAGVTAIANIPQVFLPGKSTLGVGVGGYGSQTAVAVGYSRAADNGKHIIKISTGINSQSKANFGAGYSYQF